MEALAAKLGCKVGSLHFTYLALPLGLCTSQPGYGTLQYISKGGRVTLIPSTLSSFPTYFMSLFRIPSLVCKRLEKIKRDFLWGGGNLDQKPHLVKWATVCTDKKKGGLGVRGLHKLNKALLGKWNWCFANERNALWRETISRKFGKVQGGWCSGENRENFGTGLWKEIRKDWGTLLDNAKFQIGDVSRVNFWKDLWCGEEARCRSFLTLFSLAVNKEVVVREVWDNSGVGGWSLGFIRRFNDWELMEVENFLHANRPMRVISNKEDRLILKGNKMNTYSVQLMYEALNRHVSLPLPFLVLSIWNPLVPLKVGFFSWKATWGKVLTLDQLKRRGRPLANRCYLCENEEETILFVHYLLARLLWEIILAIVGIEWVSPFSVRQTLFVLARSSGGKET